MESDNAKEHRTVNRIATILEAIAAAPDGMRLAGLVQALQAPKSSVQGLVKGLVATGYLVEQDGVYTLGPAVDALLGMTKEPLRAVAHRTLEEIERQCHESVMLCSLVGQSVVYIDLVESRQTIRYSAPLRYRLPLYPTSAGKCFLAHFPAKKRKAYLLEHIPEARRRAEIEEELARVREEGVAYSRGETFADVFAVATPVIVADKVVGCLAVAGPHARMANNMNSVAAIVKAAASGLERQLT